MFSASRGGGQPFGEGPNQLSALAANTALSEWVELLNYQLYPLLLEIKDHLHFFRSG